MCPSGKCQSEEAECGRPGQWETSYQQQPNRLDDSPAYIICAGCLFFLNGGRSVMRSTNKPGKHSFSDGGSYRKQRGPSEPEVFNRAGLRTFPEKTAAQRSQQALCGVWGGGVRMMRCVDSTCPRDGRFRTFRSGLVGPKKPGQTILKSDSFEILTRLAKCVGPSWRVVPIDRRQETCGGRPSRKLAGGLRLFFRLSPTRLRPTRCWCRPTPMFFGKP